MIQKSKTKTGYILLIIFSVLAIVASILILMAIDDSGVSDGSFRPALILIGGLLTLGFSILAINQESKNGPETKQLTLVLVGSVILFGSLIFELAIDFSDAKTAYGIIDGIPSSYGYSYSLGYNAVDAIKKLYAGEIMALISAIGIGLSAIGAMVSFQYNNSHYVAPHLINPSKSINENEKSKNNSSDDKLKKAFMDGIITAQEYEKKLKENKKK